MFLTHLNMWKETDTSYLWSEKQEFLLTLKKRQKDISSIVISETMTTPFSPLCACMRISTINIFSPFGLKMSS